MKTKVYGLLAFAISIPAFATQLEVKGWSGCTQYVDVFQGLSRFFTCEQRGTFQADTCDSAYNQLKDTQKCCEWHGAVLDQFHPMSCVVKQ